MDRPVPSTLMRRPFSLHGVPPRYQVFDRRKSPPMSVGRFYRDPTLSVVVFVVYDDVFREFLKREEPFAGRGFAWLLDVAPDALHDPRAGRIVPDPTPRPVLRGEGEPLSLEEAVAAVSAKEYYRVVRASDPV